MNNIVKPKHFDAKQIKLSEPKVNNYGGKMVFLNYIEDKQPLIIQTPVLRMPYDMSEFRQDNAPEEADSKYTISLALDNIDSNEQIRVFHDKLTGLDKELISQGVKNTQAWFKKKHKKSVIEAFYTPVVKPYIDRETGEVSDKYPPTIKLKLPRKNKKFTSEVYNDDREQVELTSNLVKKGSKVQALMRCSSVWFAGGKFGTSWTVVQMKVTPSKSLSGYSFLPDK
jgi:Protein of unknown function (DUF2738).